jgi:hypothetical protein
MLRIFYLLLLLVVVHTACSKLLDIEGIESDPTYAFPLINSRVTLRDLISGFDDNTSLLVEPSGLLKFFYRGDTIIRSSQEVFDGINSTIPPFIPVIDTLFGFPISTSTIKVDLIRFKNGRLDYSFFNNNSNQIRITISLPQILKDNIPLSRTHIVPAFSSLPTSSFDLNGVELRPLNDSIYFKYSAIDDNNESVKVSNFLLIPRNLDFTYFEGILASQIFAGELDTLEIDFYKDWVNGEVLFESPTVTINIQNSFGFPATARVRVMDIITINDDRLPLESPFRQTGFDFNYPSFQEKGKVKGTSFVFNDQNSNIGEVVNAGPTALVYDIDAVPTPNANVSGFITDSSYFAYSIDAEFPLWGRARNFSVSDTTEINLSNFDNAASLQLKIVATNKIPLGVTLQGIFLDANNRPIDSLFTKPQRIIAPANVNAQGEVISASEQVTYVPFDNAQLNKIRPAKKMILKTTFDSTNEGKVAVKVFDKQDLSIKIGAFIGF